MHTFGKLFSPVFLVLTLFAALPATAQDHTSLRRTVNVSGEGSVDVEPDMATVRFGVVTRSEDPEEARSLNAEAAREAMNAVRELGIEERKIKLEVLRLQPVHEYNQQTQRTEEKGYEAIRIVSVAVDDLEKLPTLVAQVVQKGANRLEGISYDVQDRDAVRNEALQEAVLNAREKAALLAQTLGVTLGKVITINEQGFNFPMPGPVYMERAAFSKADAAPEPEAYAAGEIEVTANVQVVFEIE